jgi:hypothetical protein
MSEIINGIRSNGSILPPALRTSRDNDVVEISDDDEDDDPVEECSPVSSRSDSVTAAWINSPTRGLNLMTPTKAARKAKKLEYEMAPGAECLLSSPSSQSPSIVAMSGGPQSPSPARRTRAAAQSSPLEYESVREPARSTVSSSVVALSGRPKSPTPVGRTKNALEYEITPEFAPLAGSTSMFAPTKVRNHGKDDPARYAEPLQPNGLLPTFNASPASSPSKGASDPHNGRLASASGSTSSPTSLGKRHPSVEPIEPQRFRPRPKTNVRSRPPPEDDLDPVMAWSLAVPPVEPVTVSPSVTPEPPVDTWSGGRTLRGKQTVRERDDEDAPVQTKRPAPKKRKVQQPVTAPAPMAAVQPVAIPAVDEFPMSMPSTSRMRERQAEKERCDAMITPEARALLNGHAMETQMDPGMAYEEVVDMEPAEKPQLQLEGAKARAYC